MALHMLDAQTLRPRFWPWPQRSWSFNKHALEAMQTCVFAEQVIKKQPELWTPDEDNFVTEVINSSAEVDKQCRYHQSTT